ncbi:MAG TPA: zinc ABC transporter substrate-binding protein, partial [Thermodesulfobacteriota bacterium]|nr:zinc ABC transporter substrate-binding protein [Thermodesulfobacteriota bacterium]
VGGHAAFAYLAERYGLQQIPLYGLSPNAEPSPKKMAELIDTAKRHQVKVIYFEQLVSDRLAKVIAREVGAETLALNNGANLTKEDIRAGTTFIHIMESNLEHLRYGLECQ